MEIPETKRFIPKEFELGTKLSYPNWSIGGSAAKNFPETRTSEPAHRLGRVRCS